MRLRLLAVLLLAFSALPLQAAELLMFRQPGCPWCAAWDRTIAPIYPKTDIGKKFTLRHVDLHGSQEGWPKLKTPVRFTPTFVLVDQGRELGRIEGYAGEHFFWAQLEGLIAK
jgi:thioredoxin-related protein